MVALEGSDYYPHDANKETEARQSWEARPQVTFLAQDSWLGCGGAWVLLT